MPEKKQSIPELRFPEFANSNKWEQTTLGSICQITNGKANAQDHVEGGMYPLFDRSDNVKASNEFLFEDDAVIIPGEGMHFIPKYYSGKFNLHQRAYALINIEAYSKFIYYNLLRNKDTIAQKAVRSTVLSLRLPILQKFPISITQDTVEQQKIADCLSSLDRLVTLEKEKLDALKDHKKGLLQSLFPAKGKKVPEKRFPEFEKDGEWEEKKLGEIGEFIGGGTPSTSKPEYWNGNINWFTPTEVKEGKLKKSKRKITKAGLKNSSAKILPKGAILITTRATIGDVGIATEECTTNQGFQSLIVHENQNNLFWYYWIQENKQDLIRRATGSTFSEISKSEILKVMAYVPEKKEQTKISSFIFNIDNIIFKKENKIEQLEEHKKGLMQRLFPKM